MEQHPVPQDIKSFQFKLIGDMTLRQFAFLAGGLVIAYVTFMLSIHPVLKWTIMISSSLFGVGCAFFPINERPLDRWVVSFFKAIFSPTQMVWKKRPPPPAFTQFTSRIKTPPPAQLPVTGDEEKLRQYLASLPKKSEELLAEEEKKFLANIQPILSPGEEGRPLLHPEEKVQKPSLAAGEIPLVQPVLKIRDLDTAAPKQIPSLSGTRVRKLGSKAQTGPAPKSVPVEIPIPLSPRPATLPKEIFTRTEEITKMAQEEITKATKLEDYQKEIETLKAEKEGLLREGERKQEETRKAREAIARITKKRGAAAATPLQKTTTVSPTPQEPPTDIQPIKKLVLPKMADQSNIITGVVADKEGNLLEGAVVVVKDQDGTPVRALKTNSLGQFATATPLANGAYSVEAEKEGYRFDIIYQEVKGGAIPPLEIRAR